MASTGCGGSFWRWVSLVGGRGEVKLTRGGHQVDVSVFFAVQA